MTLTKLIVETLAEVMENGTLATNLTTKYFLSATMAALCEQNDASHEDSGIAFVTLSESVAS